MLEVKPKFPIVIVEGGDASGKSTLISQLMERHPNNCYIHNAVTDDIKSLHENTVDTALMASQEHWVFIDRLHLSEKVYGTIFRNGPSYDVDEFDKAARKDKEMFDDVSKVWDMYDAIQDGWTRYNWKTDKIDLDTLEVSYGVKENN